MYDLAIVTHCHCPEGFGFYADALLLQLESIIRHCPEGFSTCVLVYHLTTDKATVIALDEFISSESVTIAPVARNPEQFFRRAIGRHDAISRISTKAFWLTDCDFIVQPGFFASVLKATGTYGAVYPRYYQICRTHAVGDRLIEDWSNNGMPAKLPDGLFIPERPPRAVGGMMFLSAEAAKHGYVPPDSRWLRPTDWKAFESFGCDIAHRRHLEAVGVPYRATDDIVGLYRLRHSKAGYKKGDRGLAT